MEDIREIWQPVPYKPYNERYEVSSFGRVRLKARNYLQRHKSGKMVKHSREARIKKLSFNKTYNLVYTVLRISNNGNEIQKTVYPHIMVAALFIPNYDPEHNRFAGFKDGNPKNLRYDNLYWYSQSDLSKKNHRKHPKNRDKVYNRAVAAGRALTRDQHAEIKRLLAQGKPMNIIADMFGVTTTSIRYHKNKMKNGQ